MVTNQNHLADLYISKWLLHQTMGDSMEMRCAWIFSFGIHMLGLAHFCMGEISNAKIGAFKISNIIRNNFCSTTFRNFEVYHPRIGLKV
jgi:hypothetical protein